MLSELFVVDADESEPYRVARETDSIAQEEFLGHVGQMRLHGQLADAEPLSDLCIAKAEGHEADDLAFTGSGVERLDVAGSETV